MEKKCIDFFIHGLYCLRKNCMVTSVRRSELGEICFLAFGDLKFKIVDVFFQEAGILSATEFLLHGQSLTQHTSIRNKLAILHASITASSASDDVKVQNPVRSDITGPAMSPSDGNSEVRFHFAHFRYSPRVKTSNHDCFHRYPDFFSYNESSITKSRQKSNICVREGEVIGEFT